VSSARELTGFEDDSVAVPANVAASGNTVSLTIGRFQIKTIAFKLGGVIGVRRALGGNQVRRPSLRVRQKANGMVSIDLPRRDQGVTSLHITDAGGRVVRTLSLEYLSGAVWDGANDLGDKVRSGVYLVNVDSEDGHLSGSVTLIHH
jgi:hypothetical protein